VIVSVAVITFDVLQDRIKRAYERQKNWRKVGELFGINPGTAHNIAHGYEPKSAHLRYHLDLPALVPTPPCPKCGEIHLPKRCPKSNGNKRPRRVAIRVDDPISAAASIKRHLPQDIIDELIGLLR